MTTEQVETFLTLGSLLVLAGLVSLALSAPLEWSGGVSPLSWIADRLYGVELWGAFALAAIAMSGSLYFSEVANYIPCTLCWYQRIAMYPLVVLFGIAAVRRDRGIAPYGLVLSAVGAVIAVYHLQLTWFPSRRRSASRAPCARSSGSRSGASPRSRTCRSSPSPASGRCRCSPCGRSAGRRERSRTTGKPAS